MQITLTKRFEFEASHFLTGMPPGHECGIEHHHAYAVEFTLAAIGDMANGLIVDTDRLKIDVTPVLKRIRKQRLNSITDPSSWSKRLAAQPSVENLALYFWDSLAFLRQGTSFRMIRLRVYESPMIWAEVSE